MNPLVWRVRDQGGNEHVIEVPPPKVITGPVRTFTADGLAHSLGGVIHLGDRVADFMLGGRPARMTMHGVMPRYAIRVKRARGGVSFWRSLRAALLLGSGAAGGVAAADAAATNLVWTVYSLMVDGEDHGSWVIRSVGGVAEAATFVEPGGSLPDSSSDVWPRPEGGPRT